jgi:membrane protein DedA with SNARE-associated domain
MHFSTELLTHLLDTWGYLGVFAFVAIESSGIPFPGETMLVTAAIYAGSGHLHIQFVIGAAALGAIIGDNLGYWAGREGGRPFLLRFGKYLRLDEAKLNRAEDFFARHGDKTVFLGRFVAVLRARAAFLAGVNRMPWPKFLVFNAAGGICWAILYGTLAYELGSNLPLLHRLLRDLGLGSIALAAAVLAILVLLRRRARRFEAEAMNAGSASGPSPAARERQPEL